MQVRSHTLGDIPRRSARRYPDKVAIIDGDLTLTFAEFDELVDRAAAALRDNGFAPGDRIALLAHNCWQYAVLAFATARAAVVLVPINFMLTAEEIAFILGHSRVRGFIVEHDLIPTAEQAMTHGGAVITKVALNADGQRAPYGWDDFALWLTTTTPAPDLEVADDQLLRLMYTSGTESRPKGVMHSSRSLVSNYVSTIVAGSMSADDVEIHSMPLYHCAQLDNFLATDIYLGATSIIIPRPDPEVILRGIERTASPIILRHRRSGSPCCGHRCSTRSISAQLAQGLLRRIGDADRGPSRDPRAATQPAVVELLRTDGDGAVGQRAGSREQRDHAGAAGRPAINVETTILDDTDTPVPPRDRRRDRAPWPAPDAWLPRRSRRTAEAFRGGWFHSGDLGYYDEFGLLHVVDRKKDMIKTGGENVASREVEEVLYRHPAVQEVAVFGDPASVWVEAVVAAVVARDGAA